MSRPGTKERILDAAEQLFAMEGFHKTSLRAITSRARVNLASVNYHFGSKESLMEAVIERHLIPLNKIRTERLINTMKAAEHNGLMPRVEDILRAFIEPTLRFTTTGDGAKYFITLVGRAFVEPDNTIRNTFMKLMTPVVSLMHETLCNALPNLPGNIIFCRIVFALGAMHHTLGGIRKIGQMPGGIQLPSDAESLIEMLIPFLTAGMMAS